MADTINDRVKQFRNHLNLTQKELSNLLNVKQSYYSEVESGKRNVTSKLINKLVQLKGVSADWLLSGKGEMMLSEHGEVLGGKIDNTNSLNSDISSGGKSGGLNGGQEDRYFLLQSSSRRFFEELKIEHPELDSVVTNTMLVADFQSFIDDLTKEYLYDVWRPGLNEESYWIDGKFSYKQFKQNNLQRIKSLEPLNPALEKLKEAIIQFYKDFQPLDSKRILEDHFSHLKEN